MRNTRKLAVWSIALAVAMSFSGIATAGASAPSGDKSAGLKKARAYLKPYLKIPTEIGITEPLTGDLTGKTVMFIECGVENCKQIGDQLEEPLELLGADFVRVQAGVTPQEFAAGFDQAVQREPDVVVSAAINANFVSEQLDALEEAGIPVISQATGENPTHGIDLELLSPAFWRKQGRALAAWIATDSKGDANVLYLNESVFLFAKPERQGFEKGLKAFCPECSVEFLDVAAADIGATIPGEVVSKLQADPDINYITNSYGALTIGVPAALQEAGIGDQVRIINQTGVAPNLTDVLEGRAAADLQASPLENGWVLADAAARAALGLDLSVIDDPNLPWATLLTEEDITWDVNTELFEGVKGLKAQYEKLWGVA